MCVYPFSREGGINLFVDHRGSILSNRAEISQEGVEVVSDFFEGDKKHYYIEKFLPYSKVTNIPTFVVVCVQLDVANSKQKTVPLGTNKDKSGKTASRREFHNVFFILAKFNSH